MRERCVKNANQYLAGRWAGKKNPGALTDSAELLRATGEYATRQRIQIAETRGGENPPTSGGIDESRPPCVSAD